MRERPDETEATAPVAEGATLAALIAVTKAYSVTDGASMLVAGNERDTGHG